MPECFSWNDYTVNCGNYLTNECVFIELTLTITDFNEALSLVTKSYW